MVMFVSLVIYEIKPPWWMRSERGVTYEELDEVYLQFVCYFSLLLPDVAA